MISPHGNWLVFWRVFRVVLAAAAGAYALYAVLWVLSRGVFAVTGKLWAWRPPRRVSALLAAYLYVGPVIVVNLVVVFLLFLAQYFFVHDVFEAAANPAPRLREAAVATLEKVGPDAVRRIAEEAREDPEAAWRRARGNFEQFARSAYYRWAEWLSRQLWDLYRGLDWIVLGALLVVLLGDLFFTSWMLAAFPLRLREMGRTPDRARREVAARLVQAPLFTVGVAALFVACAGAMWLFSWVLAQAAAGLARRYLVEILVAGVSGPVAPGIAFLLLAGFYLFLLEQAVLLGGLLTLFVVASRQSLRLHAGRLAARLCHVYPPEETPPGLVILLARTGSVIAKIAAATLAVWAPLAWIVFPVFGFAAGCVVALLLHVGAFNALLVWMKIGRDVRAIVDELRQSLRLPRPAAG